MARRTGGRIPPQNRPAQAPGVGRNARRHDLERRNVPFLQGSDLQQGDVQALEQGQRVQPIKRTQPPARPQRPTVGRPMQAGGGGGGQPSDIPDPIGFLSDRLGGTYQPKSGIVGRSRHDYQSWLPLLERLAKSPGASGVLVQAYITRLHNMLTGPTLDSHDFVDMQEADSELERMLIGGPSNG